MHDRFLRRLPRHHWLPLLRLWALSGVPDSQPAARPTRQPAAIAAVAVAAAIAKAAATRAAATRVLLQAWRSHLRGPKRAVLLR